MLKKTQLYKLAKYQLEEENIGPDIMENIPIMKECDYEWSRGTESLEFVVFDSKDNLYRVSVKRKGHIVTFAMFQIMNREKDKKLLERQIIVTRLLQQAEGIEP